MLERAAGCFETAGRRLLRDSPGTIQSRRSLSRHFWRHNTAEGDVARWFLALAQPTTSPPFTVLHPAHGKNSAIQVNQPFLDFLYPQNYRDWFLSKDTRHLRRPGSRRRKKGPVGFRRTFTSVVTSVDQSCPKASSGKEPLLNGANPIISTQDGVAQLRGLLTSDADWDYDRAWVSYISLGRPPDIRSELCAYLSQSAKPADQERAWELFEEIPLESRSPADFHHICKSQTYYADPPHLTTILQQALSTGVAVDFCFEASFTHYLKRHDWTRMQEVWAMRFEASELPVKGILPQLSYPELPLDVYAFAKFVRGSATEQRSHLQGISSFLLARITTTASLLESAHLDILLDTFSLFQEVGVARETHFSQAIKCLQQSTSRLKFARSIAFYRQMRSLQPAAKLPKRLMNAQILCLEKFDMTGNIPLFLDEFALFFGKPSNEAYKTAMKAFARTGHVDEVNRLFERFVADHGKPKSRKFVTSLLLVHACNGDVRETWHQFERVKAEFGLEPNVACWNLVLTAYAKTRDVIGAFSAFARMSETRVQPDSGTYNILMGLLAIRGDIDGVRKLLMLAQEQHVQITMPMLGQIISAYLKNGRLDLAERLALVCLDLKVPGSATRIFNALLMQYVFRIDHEGYRRVLAIMDKAGVPSDARTHTAGLLRLTLARKPQKAHLLLRKLHKTGELHATEVHYVIVMLGYIRNREYEQARVIIREIMGRFPDSALQTSLENVLEVIPNKLERVEGEKSSQQFAENFVIKSFVRKDLTSFYSKLGDISAQEGKRSIHHKSSNLRKTFLAHYYRSLIHQYGHEGKFDEAQAIFAKQLSSQSDGGLLSATTDTVPISLLQPMMNAHLKAGQYDQVDELWRLGFSNAIELSIPLDINELFSGRQSTTGTTSATGDVPTDKASASGSDKETSGALAPPNSLQQIQGKNKKIIPSRRFILSRLLSTYLKSLAYRGERSKITETVAKFEAAGFALSALNRSTIIEILAESDDFTDVAGAFELFETQFMPNFISWKHMRNQQGLKPPNVPKHVYTLEDRRTPQHSSRVLGKFAKLYWANMDPGFLQPSYLTMVSLAAAVKRLRNRTILHGGDEIQKLYQLAPSTLDALGTMPMYADKIQAVLLRNHAPRRGLRPRPVRYPIRPGGILGRGIHPWKSRPKHSSRDIPGGVLEDKPTGASDAMDEWYSMLGIDVVDQRVTDMPSANDFGESRLFAQKDTTSEDWEKFLSIEDRTDLKFEIVRDRAIRQSRKYRQKELTRTRSSPQKGSRRRP